MKHFYLAFWLVIFTISLSAQNTIFLFDWEGTDPKQAAIGPSASSIGAGAFTKTRLDNRTKGLAAPTTANGKADFNMVLTNNPIFNQDGIDLSFDYQRDESIATIFSRNNFRMGFDGMNARYRVREAGGGCSAQINLTGGAILDDDIYRTYRFRYDPNTGEAVLSSAPINGAVTVLATNATKTPGQALCWDGDGDITIGVAMDGSGKGNALLDNMRMEEVAFNSSLPVELTYFHAKPAGNEVDFIWQTASESDNEYFAIERSGRDGDWQEINRTMGQGNSNEIYIYEATDTDPLPGINYYRLKQVDFDGRYGYSAVKSVTTKISGSVEVAYPNPTTDFIYLTGDPVEMPVIDVYDQQGRLLPIMAEPAATGYRLDLRGVPTGVYFVKKGEDVVRVVKR